MKLIHLSDLHLGKRVNEFSMIEDQKYILNEILRIIDKEAPDGVLLAGDLYDRPIPSAEAVQLFDRFLTQLAERKIPVYAISGNHDSAERIAFGSQIMSSSGICMTPVYDGKTEKYCLTDSYGEVWIHLLPFVRPATVRHGLEGEEEVDEIRTYQEAVQAAVAHMEIDKRYRNVLIAHQFVVGASRGDEVGHGSGRVLNPLVADGGSAGRRAGRIGALTVRAAALDCHHPRGGHVRGVHRRVI